MDVIARLERCDINGVEHPGSRHSLCRISGRQDHAFTRCCNLRVEFAAKWHCEIERLPEFGVETTCCDRPYWMYGETADVEVGQ